VDFGIGRARSESGADTRTGAVTAEFETFAEGTSFSSVVGDDGNENVVAPLVVIEPWSAGAGDNGVGIPAVTSLCLRVPDMGLAIKKTKASNKRDQHLGNPREQNQTKRGKEKKREKRENLTQLPPN